MKIPSLLLVTFTLMLLCSCTSKEQVDLIVENAQIYTANKSFDIVSSFAVKNGSFVAVGDIDEIKSKYVATENIDLKSAAVLPGLIDAHCHFYSLGINQQAADLVGTTSFDQVIEQVQQFYKGKNPSVIRGRGWDQNDWEVKKFPNKKILDDLYPEIPVVLERVDGHAYLVNQKALDLAGIDIYTNVPGGSVEQESGKLTGILVDTPMGLVDAVLPKPTLQENIEALKIADDISLSYGLTTVNDAGLNDEIIQLIDSLHKANELKIRVYAMLSASSKDLDEYLKKGILKTERLQVNSVKVYADGALGSRGAALRAPYSDKAGHFGAMITTQEDMEALAEKIAASEYQMNTHAIGDSANIAVLRAYRKALKNKTDRRWKVEHAQIITPIDIDYYKDGIIPSVQPTHATSDMYWAEDRLGSHRMKGAYAYKTLLNASGIVALGTDFPVEHVSPFLTFSAAVSRQDVAGYPQGGFLPEERLSREETLKGMTLWAAYSNFQESERGSIEVGKMVDFIVLNSDIMTLPISEIKDAFVTHTYVNGELVYRK
jgi:predicted amidohydrolase YtcJ